MRVLGEYKYTKPAVSPARLLSLHETGGCWRRGGEGWGRKEKVKSDVSGSVVRLLLACGKRFLMQPWKHWTSRNTLATVVERQPQLIEAQLEHSVVLFPTQQTWKLQNE